MTNLKWTIFDNFIFGYDDQYFKNLNSISKIYFFDIDYTIIKTKSGKVFPVNKFDWTWLNNNIPTILCNISSNNLIGFISNQKGLKTKQSIDDWIYKMNDIISKINKKSIIHLIFASIKDDGYRKPMIKSWNFIKDKLFKFKIDELQKNNKIYYIGDALGRETDHSDTDIKYAINCKFKIKSPESFFKFNKINNIGSITYPTLNYFKINEQELLFNIIFEKINKEINNKNKIIIILIGFPASGKSFFRKILLAKFNIFKYYNSDDINNKINDDKLIINNINFSYIINDNTNLDNKKINIYLKNFLNYKKIGIFFNYDIEICQHLNYMRMYWFDYPLISTVIYRKLNKSFNNTDIINNYNFDDLITINKIFKDFNYDNKIKYYF